MKLYKVYLVYNTNVVMHMYFARDKEHVLKLMDWEKRDNPKPIIREIEIKEGGFMCHHIADHNFYKTLQYREKNGWEMKKYETI